MGKRAANKDMPGVKSAAKPKSGPKAKAKKRAALEAGETLPEANPEQIEVNKAHWKAMIAKLPGDPKPEHGPEESQLVQAMNM